MGAGRKAGQLGDPPDQLPEKEQPHRRLHQGDHDDCWLAGQHLELAVGHPPGLRKRGPHRAPPTAADSASASANRRPTCRRYTSSSDGRATVTAATLTPAVSLAASPAGPAAAPSSTRPPHPRPSRVLSCTL